METKDSEMAYEGVVQSTTSSSRGTYASTNGMFAAGSLLMIFGVILALSAFSYNVAVDVGDTSGLSGLPQSVANIDKISIREMILACGGFCFVGGSVLLSIGWIATTLINAARQQPGISGLLPTVDAGHLDA